MPTTMQATRLIETSSISIHNRSHNNDNVKIKRKYTTTSG